MRTFMRIWATLIIAARRILAQPGLAIAIIAGQAIAIALTMSIPAYSDAIYYQTFLHNVSENNVGVSSPFAFIFKAGGALQGPSEWEDIQLVDQYLTAQAADTLAMQPKLVARFFQTRYYELYPDPAGVQKYTDTDKALVPARFAVLSDLEQHSVLLEGVYPEVASPGEDTVVDILVSEGLALNMGLQIGERFIVLIQERNLNGIQTTTQIPVSVAGIWRATDATEAYWFTRPDLLTNQLFVPEETYARRIAPQLRDEVYTATWYLVMDETSVDNDDAGPLIERINALEREAKSLLPTVKLEISPRGELENYQDASTLLTVQLYAFSVPIVGLLLAFIGTTASLAVEQRRNEIAVLRSRGGTRLQLIGVAVAEGLLLGAVAFAVGLPLSLFIASLVTRTRSFLDFHFVSQPGIRISLTTDALLVGIFTVLLALVAQLVPTITATRYTITSYKQERARQLARPWWQRVWLDGLLLIPALYGAFLLHQQGTIVVLRGDASGSPFENPLLILLPALWVLAITLFVLRSIPAIIGLIAGVAARTKSVALVIASRHLSRTPGFYDVSLLLLIMTLSLSIFTASLALTLDNHLYDRVRYQVGADVNFSDFGEAVETGASANPSAQTAETLSWRFLPVSEYLKTPGVLSVARVGNFAAQTSLSGRRQTGAFLGIDRYDFAQTASWRADFAPASLAALTNALALAPDAVLVPQEFMREHALQLGDTIRIRVTLFGENYELDLRIVGGFDLFPTWYPEDGPLFVGNLDYLFELVGGQFPYRVWLKTNRSVQQSELIDPPSRWQTADAKIIDIQRRPERQGLYGVLSVGFAAAAVLTAFGFLLYMVFSFRRRFIEMGVLRAIGLSVRQMVGCMAWELAFLILIGSAVGTTLGIIISDAFIPYLEVGMTPAETTPPFWVQVAWQDILLINCLVGLLFCITLGILAVLLWRMRIFEAIKLGETL